MCPTRGMATCTAQQSRCDNHPPGRQHHKTCPAPAPFVQPQVRSHECVEHKRLQASAAAPAAAQSSSSSTLITGLAETAAAAAAADTRPSSSHLPAAPAPNNIGDNSAGAALAAALHPPAGHGFAATTPAVDVAVNSTSSNSQSGADDVSSLIQALNPRVIAPPAPDDMSAVARAATVVFDEVERVGSLLQTACCTNLNIWLSIVSVPVTSIVR